MDKVAKVTPNIALDSAKQKEFTKSVKKVKKQIQKASNASTRHLDKGIVYLSHIPHGFYEPEMKKYFMQFGRITNVRVLRSHKTGRSKGAAYVEFADKEVAKIAAETMDNYLMFNRRIEAKFVDPEVVHKNLFKIKITATRYPKKRRQIASIKQVNAGMSVQRHDYKVKEKLKKLKKAGQLNIVQISSGEKPSSDVESQKQPEPIVKQKKTVTAKPVIKPTKPEKKQKLISALQKKKVGKVIFEDDEIVVREPLKAKNKATPLAEKTKVKKTVKKSVSSENIEVVVPKTKLTKSPKTKKTASVIKKDNDSPKIKKKVIPVKNIQKEANEIVIPQSKLTKSPKGKISSPKKKVKTESPKASLSKAHGKSVEKKGIANIATKSIVKNGTEKSSRKTIKKTKKAPLKINSALLGGLKNLDNNLVKKVDLAAKGK